MSRITEALAKARGVTPDRASAPERQDWDFEPAGAQEVEAAEAVSSVAPAPPVIPVPAIELSAPPVASRVAAAPSVPGLAATIGPQLPPRVLEQYRKLGVTLHQAQVEHNVRIVMIASALPGEGKSFVASNVAMVLSRSYGRRVLLIDADMRKPSLHAVFGVENRRGLGDRVEMDAGGPSPVLALTPTLDFLPAGKLQADPMRVLTGDGMRQLLHDSAAAYDWVIVDTPPLGLISDAHLLATMVDRVLLVIAAGRTAYDVIQKSLSVIGKERILGAVLNRADAATAEPYNLQYEQYYGVQAP